MTKDDSPSAGPGGLEVFGLGRRLDSGGWIWRHLNLRLERGKRLALSGATGSGKTLLFRTLAGLDAPSEGKVVLDSRPQEEWRTPEFRSRVMWLPQKPWLPTGSVEEALRSPYGLAAHRERRYDRHLIENNLEEMGMPRSVLQRGCRSLSGGERQLVALLRAVQLAQGVLLLDEPTASMDAGTAAAAEALVERWLRAQPGRAYVWAGHDEAQLSRMGPARLVLDRGPAADREAVKPAGKDQGGPADLGEAPSLREDTGG